MFLSNWLYLTDGVGISVRNRFRGHSAFIFWIWDTPKSRQDRFIPEFSPLELFQFMFGALYFIIMVFETFSQSVIPVILQKLLFKQDKTEFSTPEEDSIEDVNMLDVDQELSKKMDKRKVKKRRRREKKKMEENAEGGHHVKDRETENTFMENEEEFLDMNSAFVTLAVGRKKLSNQSLSSETAPTRPRDRSSKSNEENVDMKCIAASKRLAIQGCKLAAKEHHERAIDVFTKAIELTPDDYRFYGNRSFCFCQLGQHKRALKDADKAISLAPESAKGYFRKGEALRALKKFEEAKTAFEHVLKLDQDCEDARNELRIVKKEQLFEVASKDSNQQSLNSSFDCSQSSGRSLSSGDNSLNGDCLHNGKVDSKMDPANPYGSCSLWIGNISSGITEQNLFEMFSEYGVVSSVRILPKKFCAFVNFQDPVSAGVAMKNLQRTLLGGERILIRFPDKMSLTSHKPNSLYTLHPAMSHSARSSHHSSRAISGRNWNSK
ncbi:uncharacterized protein [Hetaerina americana]|uniref:uncharacterized protein isoform X2 n=1 Tax=Hetaerina americana TaxID=62018 RepID=UPI003A7F3D33